MAPKPKCNDCNKDAVFYHLHDQIEPELECDDHHFDCEGCRHYKGSSVEKLVENVLRNLVTSEK